ncbi:MAG: tRNA (adenosine(37)-N6)-threonylcarbamoyltransferase complex ATPase subunit type 1 TsaE [bacterium]
MVETGHVVLREQGVGLKRLERIGRRLARCLRPGDLVLLYGPLGAGKTTLVRVIARALHVSDPVRSPSFTIANIYSGAVTVQHLDLYRLDEIGDDDALALEEYARGDAVTLVEWPQAGLDRLGPPAWTVRIGHETLRERSVEVEAWTTDARGRWDATGDADG